MYVVCKLLSVYVLSTGALASRDSSVKVGQLKAHTHTYTLGGGATY